jgi:hypothetical protein
VKAINLKFGNIKSFQPDGFSYSKEKLAVENTLKSVNGKAEQHAYTDFRDIARIVDAAEKRLQEVGIPKKQRKGAVVYSTSGGTVPNSYKYSRKATTIKLERKSTGWFLVSAGMIEIYKDGGGTRICLTEQQKQKGTSEFLKKIEQL